MAGENKEKKEKKEKIRQARQGKSSCMYAIFSLFVLVLLILHAYTMREKTADIAGALGLIDMMFTVFGIRAGLKGRQEPEKRHFKFSDYFRTYPGSCKNLNLPGSFPHKFF